MEPTEEHSTYCPCNSVSIVSSCLSNNTSEGHGGGAYIYVVGTINLFNDLISDNHANGTGSASGGGLYVANTDYCNIVNNTITNNSTSHEGGGLALTAGTAHEVKNSIFWGNTSALSTGNQVYIVPGAPPTHLSNCCYANPPGDVSDSGGSISATASITTDPLFRPGSCGPYYLEHNGILGGTTNSPCIDTGTSLVTAFSELTGRVTRPDNILDTGTVDIGYHYPSTTQYDTHGFDFNGDGYDDVIVGAHHDDDGGTDSGCAFIFFGGSSASITLDADVADVRLLGGDAQDAFGNALASAGDVNGDGFDDVIVGAHQDDDGGTGSGCAFIIFGSSTPPSVIDSSVADVTIVGADAESGLGFGICSPGDVNGDGIDDIIVGADHEDNGGNDSGSVFVFFGGQSMPALLDAASADIQLIGGDAADWFGCDVASGDINYDGFDDIVVGAYLDDDTGTDAGCAFVFYGGPALLGSIDSSAASTRLTGINAGDHFGCSVAIADIDGTGFMDLVIGAARANAGGSHSGCAYIFLAMNAIPPVANALTANTQLIGGDSDDYLGVKVDVGDFNCDGYGDALVGAAGDDDGGSGSGSVFVFFGGATLPGSIDAALADVRLIGVDAGDVFHSVAHGDLNGDGYDDILVGASSDDDGGTDSGCAFVFFGCRSLPTTIDASIADWKLIGGDANDNFGVDITSSQ